MKAIIIDLSRSSEVKILNTRITSTVSVVSGYYLSCPQEDDPIQVAANKLREEKLLEIPAIIIPPGDVVEKHIFHLPKMPDKEINKVLPRQIAEVKDTTETMVFSYMKNGPVEDRQVEKIEISAFFCGKEKMYNYLDRLKKEGIRPLNIIPEAQGLRTLVEINPQLHTERSGIVLLDLMGRRINLNIFRNIYWGLEREFLFRMEGGDELDDEDFTRISTELNRTFQYFKQRNRSYTIEQVVLYGSSPNLDHLKNLINDNLPTPSIVIAPEYFKGKATFPSHLKDSQEFISIFTLPIATAIAVSAKKFQDVFPSEFKEKAKLPTRLVGLAISAIIIAVILGGSAFYFEKVKKSYIDDIESIRKSFFSLNKNAGIIESTRKERGEFFKQRYYIDHPIQYSYNVSDFIRRLSFITSEKIELIEIEITPGAQTFTFLLNGKIIGNDNIDAQSKFLEFYQTLKEFNNVLNADSSDVNINSGEGNLDPNTAKKVELFFTISGEVEAQ